MVKKIFYPFIFIIILTSCSKNTLTFNYDKFPPSTEIFFHTDFLTEISRKYEHIELENYIVKFDDDLINIYTIRDSITDIIFHKKNENQFYEISTSIEKPLKIFEPDSVNYYFSKNFYFMQYDTVYKPKNKFLKSKKSGITYKDVVHFQCDNVKKFESKFYDDIFNDSLYYMDRLKFKKLYSINFVEIKENYENLLSFYKLNPECQVNNLKYGVNSYQFEIEHYGKTRDELIQLIGEMEENNESDYKQFLVKKIMYFSTFSNEDFVVYHYFSKRFGN